MSTMILVAANPDITGFALGWGKAFIRLSFAGALLSLAVIAYDAFKPRKDDRRDRGADSTSAILTALAAVLEALGKLPAWVAIYLAGFALLWLSGQP